MFRKPLIVAHRGPMFRAPENTLHEENSMEFSSDQRPTGIPTRFALWLLPRSWKIYLVLVQQAWWIVFLASLSLSLFLLPHFGLAALWIFGGSVIIATFAPVVLILVAGWAEVRVNDWKQGK